MPVRRPGDWSVVVSRRFDGSPDMVVYRIVQEDGESREHSRATADQPMPEGVELPTYALPRENAERLPPPARAENR